MTISRESRSGPRLNRATLRTTPYGFEQQVRDRLDEDPSSWDDVVVEPMDGNADHSSDVRAER